MSPSAESIRIVEEILSTVINPRIVDAINAHGGQAIGVPGYDVFRAERFHAKDPSTGESIDIGFVGQVSYSETAVIEEGDRETHCPGGIPSGQGSCLDRSS